MVWRVRICDAADVDTTHRGVRETLVMGIDTAGFTETVPRLMGAKGIEFEVVSALGDLERIREYVDIRCLSPFAEGAVAAGDAGVAFGCMAGDLDCSAVAGGSDLEAHLRFTFGI